MIDGSWCPTQLLPGSLQAVQALQCPPPGTVSFTTFPQGPSERVPSSHFPESPVTTPVEYGTLALPKLQIS